MSTIRPSMAAKSRLALWCLPVILLAALFFGFGYKEHIWLVDAQGKLMPIDFVNVWVSGVMAGEGQAPQCYDWEIHKARELTYTTPSFSEYLAWLYPPVFFFIAQPLGYLSYQGAWLAWMLGSGALFLFAMHRILRHRVAFTLALAFPTTLGNFLLGQNGMFTAGLLGLFLYFMDRRPVLAGIALGLLAYKPQFSFLLPLVMLLEKRWRLLASTMVTGLAWAGLSVLVYGLESWQAFLTWMPINADRFLNEGQARLEKQQSMIGLVRTLGGSQTLAQLCWLLLAVAALVLTVKLRRRTGNSAIGAALLATLTMAAAPYVYFYDQVVLVIALAFFLQQAFEQGFLRYEVVTLIAITALLFLFLFMAFPWGLFATLLLMALLVRRARLPAS